MQDLGCVGGIPVAIHASWLVAFGLMSGVLAGGLLPLEAPGWRPALYWVVGVLTSALLFAGLLIHELAHCWMARREGLAAHRVTLFIFGGVSEIDGEPGSPQTALRIAAAGPLTSFALAALCLAAAALTRDVELVAAPLMLLARLNVVLAIFNMLPGHPLDGGRLLHAAVWISTGDRERALLVSARAGRWLSIAIVVVGMLLLLRGAAVGLWLVLIGWLQHATAVATVECVLLHRASRGHGGGRDGKRRHSRAARCAGRAARGRADAARREDRGTVPVQSIMCAAERLVTGTPDEPLVDAVRRMDDARVPQLPVVAAGRIAGLLTREQVLGHVRAWLDAPR
jgi:Zn-dependent protease